MQPKLFRCPQDFHKQLQLQKYEFFTNIEVRRKHYIWWLWAPWTLVIVLCPIWTHCLSKVAHKAHSDQKRQRSQEP